MAIGRASKFGWAAATLLALLSGCSPSEPAPSAPAATPAQPATPPAAAPSVEINAVRPIVVMLGDSLTAGFGLDPADALPDQIAATLKARAVRATLINAGVSGDTTRGGLERYEWSVAGVGADIVIIALGANDFLNGLPAEQARANLSQIIERAQQQGVRVALAGVGLRTPGASRDPQEEAYADVYRSLAKTYEVALFPDILTGLAGRPELLQADGLHPTAAGVKAMAAAMADFVAGEVAAWNEGR